MSFDPPALPPSELPRERLRRLGIEALSDAELLALVLGSARNEEPALELATHLLGTYGGARGLLRTGVGAIAHEVGFARAARLAGATELSRRALATPLDARAPFTSSRDVVNAFGPRLIDRVDECVYAVLLDARQRPLAERQLASGGPSSCPIGVREVFALAVREGGAAVLLVHNHPSGDPTPSTEDLQLTAALADAGTALELPLLDHVIIAREGSFSFLDAGLLRTGAPPAHGVTGGVR
jgi:DNA repair protein RadC